MQMIYHGNHVDTGRTELLVIGENTDLEACQMCSLTQKGSMIHGKPPSSHAHMAIFD